MGHIWPKPAVGSGIGVARGYHGPHLAEAARRELDARGAAELGVPREPGVPHAVLLQVRELHVACGQKNRSVVEGSTLELV